MPRLLLPALALTLSSTFAPALCGPFPQDTGIIVDELKCGTAVSDNSFDDEASIIPGMKFTSASIRGSERVNRVELGFTTPIYSNKTFVHGGNEGTEQKLNLADGEYVTTVKCHADDKGVTYLEFQTNIEGHSIHVGTPPKDPISVLTYLPPGARKIGGFKGYLANEGIAQLQIIWINA